MADRSADRPTSAQSRRSRREYIRTHHPDAGGDPADFVIGLANFDSRPTPRVFVTKSHPWPVTIVTGLAQRIRRSRRPPRVR